MKSRNHPNRRQFLKAAVLTGAGAAADGIKIASAFAQSSGKSLVLATQEKSTYSIVISGAAPPAELRAAAELQRFIQQMTGARLPITRDAQEPGGDLILVGDSNEVRKLGMAIPFDQLGPEGFVLRTQGSTLIIVGGKPRGTMYGVYTLLDQLGCRWFTPEVSIIPRKPALIIDPMHQLQRPAFEYREPFFTEAFDKDWAARNRVNGSFLPLDDETGGKVRYFPFVHSFYSILPPQQYFHDHPEYYALVDGTRRGRDAQLCLTNPDVLRLTVQRVQQWISEHPDASIFSVSQNDTQGWCECENCARVEQEEGGAHSGPILRFVNAVATEVGKTHPEKLIDTLAYWYSEPPPLKVRPLPNVRVRLCPIGACEAHAYKLCEYDQYFLQHLQAWGNITDQLYIWHYVTNFAHYLMPFPDFDELAADIPLYKKNGVMGIFLEGDAAKGGGGENAELRSYVMARLLWDSETDVNQTVNEFMSAFYGPAAKTMRGYFDLQHQQVRFPLQGKGDHMWIYTHPGAAYVSGAFLIPASKLLDEAESLAADDVTRRRVRKARLSVDYVKLIRAKTFRVRDGYYAPENVDQLRHDFQDFMQRVRSFGMTELLEGHPLEDSEAAFARLIKLYSVVTLENSHLRVVVAPELTARIISIVDKRTNTELVRQPDPGERTYPDVSGAALYACADYLQAKTYDLVWQLAAPAGAREVRLAGTCPEGLKMQRTIRLHSHNPVIYTESALENTGNSPLDAVLSARYDAAPADLKTSRVIFQTDGGNRVCMSVLVPGTEPTGTIWYADSEQPDGEWSVNGAGEPADQMGGLQTAAAEQGAATGQFTIVNRFPREQAARASVNWSGKADRRVTLNVWSAKRTLAGGEILKLETEYEVKRSS